MRLSPEGQAIRDAGAHPYIVAALKGRPYEARIANTYQFVCSGDTAFNALTAAYQLLRRAPEKPLVESQVQIETNPDSTLHMLAGMLNNTLHRDRSPHPQSYDHPDPLYGIIGYCENSEPGLLRLARQEARTRLKIYHDEQGNPVFAKGCPAPGKSTSALALQPTRLWGVHMPAGLIAEVHDQPGSPEPTETTPVVAVPSNSEHIRQVYPMRLSRFALSHAAREQAFGAYEANRTIMNEVDRNITIPQLAQLLI